MKVTRQNTSQRWKSGVYGNEFAINLPDFQATTHEARIRHASSDPPINYSADKSAEVRTPSHCKPSQPRLTTLSINQIVGNTIYNRQYRCQQIETVESQQNNL
jgi:hypothetical protein